jgi:DNA-binding protein
MDNPHIIQLTIKPLNNYYISSITCQEKNNNDGLEIEIKAEGNTIQEAFDNILEKFAVLKISSGES